MRVVIVGGNGQLGMDLMKAFDDERPVGLTHEDIEIGNIDAVHSILDKLKPGLVINTAAYHKVDDCEKYPEKSFHVNALGAFNLAKATASMGCEFVHISTDYVFDGEQRTPYRETDRPNPLSVYGVTKLAGEHLVVANAEKYYLVRSSGLYGHNTCRAKGRNFIDTMLKFAKEKNEVRVVQDEILTPTYTFHLARQIRELVGTHAYGLYHITNNGSCSWYEFAKEIFRHAGITTPLIPTTVKEFFSPIKRPHYSVLENAKLQSLSMDHMPEWGESLAHYFSSKSG